MFKLYALLAISLLHSVTASQERLLRGVPPELVKVYNSGEKTFKCLDGSKVIPTSSVNDDYCDCKDGSDEPGTSACPNAKFFCKNLHYIPARIPSSKVNDGICDDECCDGSDEYDGKVKCPNTCAEKKEAMKAKELERQRKTHAKLQMLHEIPLLREERKAELAINRAHLLDLEVQLGQWKEKVDPLHHQYNTREEKRNNRGLYDECEHFVSPLTNMVKKLLTSIQDLSHKEDDDVKQVLAKAKDVSFEMDAIEHSVTVPKYEDEFDYYAEIKAYHEEVEIYYNGTRDYLKNLDRRENQTYTNADGALEALDGDCLYITSGYDYVVCPFNNVTQEIGNRFVLLGEFTGFDDNDKVMVFQNGHECWNGLHRSLRLTMECAETNEIVSISEPSTCQYIATMKTPAVCTMYESDKKGFVPSKTRVYPLKKPTVADDDVPVHDDL